MTPPSMKHTDAGPQTFRLGHSSAAERLPSMRGALGSFGTDNTDVFIQKHVFQILVSLKGKAGSQSL